MADDRERSCDLPSVGRKKMSASFDGGRISSDGGVMVLAQAERRLGLADRLAALIADRRDGARVIHPLARLLAIACGYEDANDL
ncbi:MAG: IS1380 family transposase, partial [Alphaproteobacteria bacterium]|nr:IS1380 family transposase [Alphaproteobacteria bacterium]MBM3492382.1 IS1380 family transposase [Alphaproteobacteria bacterium]